MAQLEINVIIMTTTTTTNPQFKRDKQPKKGTQENKKSKYHIKNTKMIDLNSTTLITTLNINGLNSFKKGWDYQNR